MTPKQTTPFVQLFSVPACPARNVPFQRGPGWNSHLGAGPAAPALGKATKARVSSDQCQCAGGIKGPEPFPFHCAAPEESCVCSRWAGWDLGGVVSLFWGFGFFCGFFYVWGDFVSVVVFVCFCFGFCSGFCCFIFKYPLCICFCPQKGEEFCKSTGKLPWEAARSCAGGWCSAPLGRGTTHQGAPANHPFPKIPKISFNTGSAAA